MACPVHQRQTSAPGHSLSEPIDKKDNGLLTVTTSYHGFVTKARKTNLYIYKREGGRTHKKNFISQKKAGQDTTRSCPKAGRPRQTRRWDPESIAPGAAPTRRARPGKQGVRVTPPTDGPGGTSSSTTRKLTRTDDHPQACRPRESKANQRHQPTEGTAHKTASEPMTTWSHP